MQFVGDLFATKTIILYFTLLNLLELKKVIFLTSCYTNNVLNAAAMAENAFP